MGGFVNGCPTFLPSLQCKRAENVLFKNESEKKHWVSAVAISMFRAVRPNIIYAFDHFHEKDTPQIDDTEISQL